MLPQPQRLLLPPRQPPTPPALPPTEKGFDVPYENWYMYPIDQSSVMFVIEGRRRHEISDRVVKILLQNNLCKVLEPEVCKAPCCCDAGVHSARETEAVGGLKIGGGQSARRVAIMHWRPCPIWPLHDSKMEDSGFWLAKRGVILFLLFSLGSMGMLATNCLEGIVIRHNEVLQGFAP